MFNTLDGAWERSARRGWTTLASFTAQALGLSLLVAISLLWVEGPPRVRWLEISAPAAFAPVAEAPARGHHSTAVSKPNREEIVVPIIAPPSVPSQIALANDRDSVPAAPDLPNIGNDSGRGPAGFVPGGLGDDLRVVIPPRPAAAKPLIVSTLAEANLLHRVQPVYPPIAREAGVQGAVELRAIISKAGTIENLVVVRGHPMLVKSALDAVRQWRYRPYLLNREPVEVETGITVNFVLSAR